MSIDRNEVGRSKEIIPRRSLRLDEIEGGEIKWLWNERVPVGHVTVLAGEGGSGKSVLAAEIAARVSSGTGGADAKTVIIAHSNRYENTVLKRRLIAAGADAEQVAVFNPNVGDHPAEGRQNTSPAGELLCTLEGTLAGMREASLVVIDSMPGWLGQARLRPEELTRLFAELGEMAARYRVAVVVLWRLEKGGRAA